MSQLTPKQAIEFRNRKVRFIKGIVENLQYIAKQKNPPMHKFDEIRKWLAQLEELHTDIGKKWLTAEKIFWERYNIDKFLEDTNLCTKEHLYRCKNGTRAYTERMKECIVNYLQYSGL